MKNNEIQSKTMRNLNFKDSLVKANHSNTSSWPVRAIRLPSMNLNLRPIKNLEHRNEIKKLNFMIVFENLPDNFF